MNLKFKAIIRSLDEFNENDSIFQANVKVKIIRANKKVIYVQVKINPYGTFYIGSSNSYKLTEKIFSTLSYIFKKDKLKLISLIIDYGQ